MCFGVCQEFVPHCTLFKRAERRNIPLNLFHPSIFFFFFMSSVICSPYF